MHQIYINGMLLVFQPVLKSKAKAEQFLKSYRHNRMGIVWDINQVHRAANEKETVRFWTVAWAGTSSVVNSSASSTMTKLPLRSQKNNQPREFKVMRVRECVAK